MDTREAKDMIPMVRISYGTDNFTRGSYNANHWFECVDQALDKQIPKKPVWTIPARKRSGHTWCCPTCGYTAIRTYNYCQHDGTKFDWSEVEE